MLIATSTTVTSGKRSLGMLSFSGIMGARPGGRAAVGRAYPRLVRSESGVGGHCRGSRVALRQMLLGVV